MTNALCFAKYDVSTCCGGHLEFVVLAVPAGCDTWDYRHEAVKAAGYDPCERCNGCYDNAFRASFVEFVNCREETECNG